MITSCRAFFLALAILSVPAFAVPDVEGAFDYGAFFERVGVDVVRTYREKWLVPISADEAAQAAQVPTAEVLRLSMNPKARVGMAYFYYVHGFKHPENMQIISSYIKADEAAMERGRPGMTSAFAHFFRSWKRPAAATGAVLSGATSGVLAVIACVAFSMYGEEGSSAFIDINFDLPALVIGTTATLGSFGSFVSTIFLARMALQPHVEQPDPPFNTGRILCKFILEAFGHLGRANPSTKSVSASEDSSQK